MPIAEIITIGNEILDGRVTDTNRVFLGRRLKELDFETRYAQSVDDNVDRVAAALSLAASRSDLIICTGGLGPTTDDLTAEAAAKFLSCPWEINPQAESFLRELFASRQRNLHESQLKQAKLPRLCPMIHNPVGTAPGFFYRGPSPVTPARNVSAYFFPGVPGELVPMFEQITGELLPATVKMRRYTWSTIFTSEGDLQDKIKDLEKDLAPFRINFRTQLPENFVSLMGSPASEADEALWERSVSRLSEILSPVSYHAGDERNYEELFLEKLSALSARLLIVESCTGGLIANLLTDVPGSSASVWGSQVCYANEEKFRLGVNPETIKKHGAVSEECAREMAMCGLRRLQQDSTSSPLICMAITGIAGPGGGSAKKPVGLMYVAVAASGKFFDTSSGPKILVQKTQAPGFLGRKSIKLYMAKQALNLVRVNFL